MKKVLFFLIPWIFIIFLISGSFKLSGQSRIELNSGWKCAKIADAGENGEKISVPSYSITNWMPAVVPGTVLTTLLKNDMIPDPFYGMNNEKIPDIYTTGNSYYTYWFAMDLSEKFPEKNELVWLCFRGVNYSCNVYLNGHQLNKSLHQGMFLRQKYNITKYLSRDGKNRIAVIVYPADPAGNPNGGQGGDGLIGRNVSHQYVAGWDWIQPVRDRNTGIWDKVFLERTGPVNIINPHVITHVEGRRLPGDPNQQPALIRVSTELDNPTDKAVSGILKYSLDGKEMKMSVTVPPDSILFVQFPDFSFNHPKLWWPNGYGEQKLYNLKMDFLDNGSVLTDSETVRFGIREITTPWNPFTQSRQFEVNGQKVFIKGGNWIISDAMLRFSKERYDAEVRFHHDMNLNLIRIWGGAITERPEFYEACDKYGILVWQDFWMSGDCNGRWQDRMKKDDQWERRKYPDDHELFIKSVVDQVKMIRNHPSLLIWSGGNEITPPEDINKLMKDTLQTDLDGTRLYIESSTSGELYNNFIGSTGDGPYSIQHLDVFWKEKSFPFNPELGSVGTGDYESLKRFIPDTSMVIPGKYQSKTAEPDNRFWHNIEPTWRYHKYLGYGDFTDKYGGADDVKQYSNIVQLINFDQYRGLVEGFSSHMWEWYTGFIIWKTQNPWTALRGQMYDWYLDPNACLYGLHHGSEPLHIMFDPVEDMIMIANNTFYTYNSMMAEVKAYDITGKAFPMYRQLVDVTPTSVKKCQSIERGIKSLSAANGLFLSLKLFKSKNEILSENLYWLPDSIGNYPILRQMPKASVQASAVKKDDGKIEVTLSNNETNPLAFFIRLSLVNTETNKRILPVFYSDNYVSIEPGEIKIVQLQTDPSIHTDNAKVQVEGWNVISTMININ